MLGDPTKSKSLEKHNVPRGLLQNHDPYGTSTSPQFTGEFCKNRFGGPTGGPIGCKNQRAIGDLGQDERRPAGASFELVAGRKLKASSWLLSCHTVAKSTAPLNKSTLGL